MKSGAAHHYYKAERYRVEDRGFETPCHIWLLSLNKDGYGQEWAGGRSLKAHRAAYERSVGKIPAGMVLDHLCKTRSCVNPDHLQPVTPFENARRRPTHLTKIGLDGFADLCERVDSGESQSDIARELGIPKTTISAAYIGWQAARKRWGKK